MRALFLAIVSVGFLLAHAPAASAATSNVYVTQLCSGPGRVSLGFSWDGASPSARQVWLDLSTRSQTWAPGTFTSFGPLPATRNFYNPGTISSGQTVYIRVNQLLPNGRWDASETFFTVTRQCTGSSTQPIDPGMQPPDDPPCEVPPDAPPSSGPRRGYYPDEEPGDCDVPNVVYGQQ